MSNVPGKYIDCVRCDLLSHDSRSIFGFIVEESNLTIKVAYKSHGEDGKWHEESFDKSRLRELYRMD